MIKQEITDIVYDTLMQNRQHLQLALNRVENQEVDAKGGLIMFEYCGTAVKIDISIRKQGVWL